MKYNLSSELINAILQYLYKQPFAEVFSLIANIQKEMLESKDKGKVIGGK